MMTLLSLLMIIVGFGLIVSAPLSDAEAGRTFDWSFILIVSGTIVGMMGFVLFAHSL